VDPQRAVLHHGHCCEAPPLHVPMFTAVPSAVPFPASFRHLPPTLKRTGPVGPWTARRSRPGDETSPLVQRHRSPCLPVFFPLRVSQPVIPLRC